MTGNEAIKQIVETRDSGYIQKRRVSYAIIIPKRGMQIPEEIVIIKTVGAKQRTIKVGDCYAMYIRGTDNKTVKNFVKETIENSGVLTPWRIMYY